METAAREKLTKRALYLQVYDILADRITRGAFADGTYLPNEYDLSRELEVSIGTIRKAVDLLTERSLVIRQQGKGTLVSDRRWLQTVDKVNRIRFGEQAAPGVWRYDELEYAIVDAEPDISVALKLMEGEQVHRVHRMRSAPPKTRIDEKIYVPVKLIAELPLDESGRRSFASLLRRGRFPAASEKGRTVGKMTEKVTAVRASERGAALLYIEPGDAILKMTRTLFDETGEPVEYRVSHCASEDGYYWCRC
ncbi:MAG: GntR family transcriptional regulator [Beijerinckiaceae bacterium]